MSDPTEAFHNRLTLVFDFDRTLGRDCADAVIEDLGGEPADVRREFIEPKSRSWDDNLARLYGILEFAAARGENVTRERLRSIG